MAEGDARRHFADLVDEALWLGFEHIELEREAQEGALGPGWRLTVAGGVAGELAASRRVSEIAVNSSAGGAYIGELSHLLRLWARHEIPAEDRARIRGPVLKSAISDLGFFVRFYCGTTDGPRELADALLALGIPVAQVAAAFREAFGADEAA